MPSKNKRPTAAIRLLFATLIAAAFVMSASSAIALTNTTSNTNTANTSATKQTTTAAACKVDPKQPKLQDQLANEKPLPWKRNGAKQVVIYFESGKVTSRYKTAMVNAARAWSKSPCVELKVVAKCPNGVRCVPATLKKSGEQPDTVGMFFGLYKDNYIIKGRLEFYTKRLSSVTDSQITTVAVHEMGHALGLGHRKSKGTIMSKIANPKLKSPSVVEFQNIRVLYGKQR